jgi:hypothetical protein
VAVSGSAVASIIVSSWRVAPWPVVPSMCSLRVSTGFCISLKTDASVMKSTSSTGNTKGVTGI